MKKVKVNFDTWIQLLGMTGVLGGLIFVGLEMRQSQQIALAAQQQARTEIFTGIVNSVNESSEVSLYQILVKARDNEPLTASEKKSLKIMPFRQFGFLKMISFNTKLAL
jgi:hypothetical protein